MFTAKMSCGRVLRHREQEGSPPKQRSKIRARNMEKVG